MKRQLLDVVSNGTKTVKVHHLENYVILAFNIFVIYFKMNVVQDIIYVKLYSYGDIMTTCAITRGKGFASL